jgi:hypothetical protein
LALWGNLGKRLCAKERSVAKVVAGGAAWVVGAHIGPPTEPAAVRRAQQNGKSWIFWADIAGYFLFFRASGMDQSAPMS